MRPGIKTAAHALGSSRPHLNRAAHLSRLVAAAPLLLCVVYVALGGVGLSWIGASPVVVGLSVPLGATLLWLSAIDMRTMRLPDAITLPLAVAGPLLAWAFDWRDPLWHTASAAAAYLFLSGFARAYAVLRGRVGLGLGDAKLFAAAGGWLGLGGLPSVLLWATATALLLVLIAVLLRQPLSGASRIPFGPFLALGFWLVWLFGPVA
jgi:leader peptidase (prepilin peptidase)/N-methyltransferase